MIDWIWIQVKRHPYVTMGTCVVLAVPTYFILPIVGISALSVGVVTSVWAGTSFLVGGCLGSVAEQYSAYRKVVNKIKKDKVPKNFQTRLAYIHRHPEDIAQLRQSYWPGAVVDGLCELEKSGCLNLRNKKFLMNNPYLSSTLGECISQLKEAKFNEADGGIERFRELLLLGDDHKDVLRICNILCEYKKACDKKTCKFPYILSKSRQVRIYFEELCKTPGCSNLLIVQTLQGLSLMFHENPRWFDVDGRSMFLASRPKPEVILGFYAFFTGPQPSMVSFEGLMQYLRKNIPALFNAVGQALYDWYQKNPDSDRDEQLKKVLIKYEIIQETSNSADNPSSAGNPKVVAEFRHAQARNSFHHEKKKQSSETGSDTDTLDQRGQGVTGEENQSHGSRRGISPSRVT